MDVDVGRILLNIADAVTLGIPSTVILSEIQEQYDVELADLNRLYNALQQEYSNLGSQYDSASSFLNDVKTDLYSATPLGSAYSVLRDKYQSAKARVDTISDAMNANTTKVRETADKIASTQKEASSSTSLGGALKTIFKW